MLYHLNNQEDLKAPRNSIRLLNQILISIKKIRTKLTKFRIFQKEYRLSIFTNVLPCERPLTSCRDPAYRSANFLALLGQLSLPSFQVPSTR